jgi:hypothetical protein
MSCNNNKSRNGCEKSSLENYPKDDWRDEFEEICAKQDCLKNAIIAATNFDNRKMPDHQYKIGRKKMKEFGEILLQIEREFIDIRDFDNLYDKIFSNKLVGIGALTVYDTATRIGAYLKFIPDKIYLHAGTLLGAENLLGKNKTKGKKHITKEFLIENCPKHHLPEFQDFNPAHIENTLCTNKKKYKS